MTQDKFDELKQLAKQRYDAAASYVRLKGAVIVEKKAAVEAELPGYEDKPMKFGDFDMREYAVMMTDIRGSTALMNQPNGLANMFVIFYVLSAVVANIIDSHGGTSTEFLGDGVLSMFPNEGNRDDILRESMIAAQDILFVQEQILNPLYLSNGLPAIIQGIGIDYGRTIVTRFGFKTDNDLKAFGNCIHNASKLSKGNNEIIVSDTAQNIWPTRPEGRLQFTPYMVNDTPGFLAKIN